MTDEQKRLEVALLEIIERNAKDQMESMAELAAVANVLVNLWTISK